MNASDPTSDFLEHRADPLRVIEALLFASTEPLSEEVLAAALPSSIDVSEVLRLLQGFYAARGVNLVQVAGGWAFRSAPDLAFLFRKEAQEERKLSRPALETLAIIAYHQPVTRAEIEDIRGVSTARGTLDVLLEAGWIRMRGRRKSPGRPVTFGTTPGFLAHFGLEMIGDLPGLEELKGAGLVEGQVPPGFSVPMPSDDPTLRDDEDPDDQLDFGLVPAVEEDDGEPDQQEPQERP
jgi:segregation and condensation protein B